MKKPMTIFDVSVAEDISSPPDSEHTTQSKDREKIEMLLRKYNTEIFDPDTRELACPARSEIDLLMEKTKQIRALKNAGHKIIQFRHLAYAACFFVICGLSLFLAKGTFTRPDLQGTREDMPSEEQFRGVAPSASVAPAREKKEAEPLAYLVDMQGEIEISRQNEKKDVPSSCEVLYKGDVVVLADKANAKVMYADAFFNLAGPMQYKIEDPDPVFIGQNKGATQRLEPSISTRGMDLGLNSTPAIVMPPKNLLASAVAPITRAGSDGINVYSPKGASFTDKPVIRIGGDPNLSYTVSILDLEGAVIGKPVSIKGKTQRAWTDFTSSPIVEDEIYTLRVQQNGIIVNDINNASFWLLSKQDKEKVTIALKYVDSIKSKQERTFFRANAFYMNGCYAEAYAIVRPLADKYPQNALYSNLVQLTHNALRIK